MPIMTMADNALPHLKDDRFSSSAITLLIYAAATICSLEVLQRPLAARLLAAVTMIFVWVWCLPTVVQRKSILASILYQCAWLLRIKYDQWKQHQEVFRWNPTHLVISWTLFWMRLFVWSTTFASTTWTFPFDETYVVLRLILTVVHCEVTEVLLLLYFADATTATLPYQWKKRWPLWIVKSIIMMMDHVQWLSACVDWTPSVWMTTGALLIAMLVSMHVPWHRLWDQLSSRFPSSVAVSASSSSKSSHESPLRYLRKQRMHESDDELLELIQSSMKDDDDSEEEEHKDNHDDFDKTTKEKDARQVKKAN